METIARIGTAYIKEYQEGQKQTKGFALLTKRILHIGGQCFHYDETNKRMEDLRFTDMIDIPLENIRNIKEVTKRHGFLLLIAIPFIAFVLYFIAVGSSDMYKYPVGEIIGSIIFLSSPVIALLLAYALIKKSTHLVIYYEDTNIAFYKPWYSKNELHTFAKALRKAKTTAENTQFTIIDENGLNEDVSYQSVPNVPAEDNTIMHNDETIMALREYAKLKEDGIITEQEFTDLKNKLLFKNN